ncbi:MAG: type II secretion system protein GspL [Pseudomonadota bacterium]
MADYQVIQLRNDSSCRWVNIDSGGMRKSEVGDGTLDQAASANDGRPVIGLLPSEEVLTLTTELRARGNRLLNALPFALEDHVADDVDSLHFAPGTRLDNGLLPVAVIARDTLDHWLEVLRFRGLEVERLIPEYHGVSDVPNTLSLFIEGNTLMFNDGKGLIFTMSHARPVDVLAAAGYIEHDNEEDDRPTALQVYCDDAAESAFASDWDALRHELDSVDVLVLNEGALPRLATAVATGAGVNLLKGAYASKTSTVELIKPWKVAAGLLVALLFTGFAGKVADYVRLGEEEAALKARFTEEYRSIRPSDQREILDPVGTMGSLRRSLGEAAGPGSVFLPSMQVVASAVGGSNSQIEAISYRAGVVDLRLTAPDVAALDRIQQSVNASQRFTATIQSTTQSADGINSRLQIREGS